mmetsp:Transcript_393/g.3008  ORF Transcript_393/g.3008 Transcript_393/m.3008 type:complete len:213 (+) Transcript_393:1477-2115(+)
MGRSRPVTETNLHSHVWTRSFACTPCAVDEAMKQDWEKGRLDIPLAEENHRLHDPDYPTIQGLLLGGDGSLLLATKLLGTVFALLDLLARRGHFLCQSEPDQTVCGLEFLCSLHTVVDKSKPCAPTSAELGAKTEEDDGLRVAHVVHLAELFLQFGLGHIRSAWMQYVHDELPPLQQTIRHELACANGARLRLSHGVPISTSAHAGVASTCT